MPANHFKLFGLPQSFTVDLPRLDRVYRELQRGVHPDRFANASDQERRLSIQQAARINEAYDVLKDPLRRGRYLLELHGHPVDDEQNITRNTRLLTEQMELREALSEVRGNGDPLAALNEIKHRVSAHLEQAEADLAACLRQDAAGRFTGSPEQALETLLKMKFYRRLQEETLDLEAGLEDDLA